MDPVIGVEPAHMTQYVICFALGTIAFRHNSLDRINFKSAKRWFVLGQFLILIVFPALFLFAGGAENVELFMGGFTSIDPKLVYLPIYHSIISDQFEFSNLFVNDLTINKAGKEKHKEWRQKKIIEKLTKAFDHDRIYAMEGITISRLSEVINEKEYLVRRAINGELGYTNFNNYLNHYRIREARELIRKNPMKELTF